MAGHSKFKNIMHRKGAQDAKRAKLFTKLIREIITAVRMGQPDPNFNPRLRSAIITARALNLPKDRIENAIKKGSQGTDGDNYEEIRYEGYAPGGIAIIVEALTDNRNRTASEVRSAFTKSGGTLGETGSVSFMFDRIGLVQFPGRISTEDGFLEAAIEAGADSCESNEDMHEATSAPERFNEMRDSLVNKFGDPELARLSWKPTNLIRVEGDSALKLMKLIDTLEDSDDVQYVCGNYEIADEVLANL